MTLSIANIRSYCHPQQNPSFLKDRSNQISLITDVALVAGLAAIGGLILGGVINIGLPVGVGTLGNTLGWGLIAGSVVIFLGDGMTSLLRSRLDMYARDLNPLVPFQLSGSSSIDASYDHENNSGILDLAYCDSQLGFGCIVDGTGHNNSRMQTALKEHFDPFVSGYAEGLANIETQEELSQYFGNKIRELEGQFRDKDLPVNKVKVHPLEKLVPDDGVCGTFIDPTYKPAMSMVQLVPVQNRLTLLTAQAGDTMVIYEMPNGELHRTQENSHVGFGEQHQDAAIQAFDITGAKRVIGFSDGIGEFMTFDELKEVIISTKSDQLFNRLKDKAMSNREIKKDEVKLAANGARLKSYEKGNLDRVDDMGLFVLEMTCSQ